MPRALQPGHQRLVQHLGHRRRVGQRHLDGRRLGGVQRRPRELLEVQRDAVALGDERDLVRRREDITAELVQQRDAVGLVHGAELDPHGALAAGHIGGVPAGEHDDRVRVGAAQQPAQQRTCLVVEPVDVLDDDERAARVEARLDHRERGVGDAVPEAAGVGLVRGVAGGVGIEAEERGQEREGVPRHPLRLGQRLDAGQPGGTVELAREPGPFLDEGPHRPEPAARVQWRAGQHDHGPTVRAGLVHQRLHEAATSPSPPRPRRPHNPRVPALRPGPASTPCAAGRARRPAPRAVPGSTSARRRTGGRPRCGW